MALPAPARRPHVQMRRAASKADTRRAGGARAMNAQQIDAQHEITERLVALRDGEDAGSWDELIGLVYPELRAIAHRQLRKEREGHTLNTTALVHEAYLRFVDLRRIDWQDRAHFFGIAARVMRQ